MYAVVTTVSIAPGQSDGARKTLNEQVVPRVKQVPGFVKGFWTVGDDSSHGTSIVVFMTKEAAEGAMGMVRNSPPPPGVTISSIEVREVIAEA